MNRIKGILYAIVSSSTFGLAPFFTLTLLSFGYSSFEVLTYRWGIASLCLIGFGLLAGCNFRLSKKDFGVVFFLTSSLRTPKFFVKEFSYFLMPCHQHGLRINLLVQR